MTRILLELDVIPCRHPNAKDHYEEGYSYPKFFKCPDCGSMFPTTGDTDLWAEGVTIRELKCLPASSSVVTPFS